MRLPSSLQSAFTLHFAIAAVVPVLVFGLLIDRYLASQHVELVERELMGHTLGIRGEVQALLVDVVSNIHFVQRSVLEEQHEGHDDNIDTLLNDSVAISSYFEVIYLLDSAKRVVHLGVDEALIGHKEDYLNLDFSRYQMSKSPLHGGGSKIHPEVWSDTFISLASGEAAITLVVPAGDGLLMGVVNLKRLDEILKNRLHQRREIAYAIMDRKGTLLAHTDRELALQRPNMLLLHTEIADALTSGMEVGNRSHEDNSLLESVRLIPETNWVVHASMNRELAMSPLQEVREILMFMLLLAGLTAVAGATWLAQRVVRPLHELRTNLQGVTRGDYQGLGKLGDAGYSELREVAESFVEMGATVLERETFLRASEERYRSLITGMGEGLLVINRQGRVTDSNEITERIFSLSRQEIFQQEKLFSWPTIREDGSVIVAEDLPYMQTLRDGSDVNNKLIGVCPPDGREIWLQVNCRPQLTAHGEVNAAVLTFADVTRLKVTESSLRMSRQRFQELYQQFSALLEGITDRISLLDRDMNVIWTNQGDIPKDADGPTQPLGSCCYRQFFGLEAPCPDCPTSKTLASGEPAIGEVVDTQGRVWNLRSFPVINAGEVAQVVVIAGDITQQREAERQSTRAGQLAALGELAAGVAHEINNPISGVINYAQLILNKSEEGSREFDLSRRIIKEGDRIATIVRELLTFAREESSEVSIVSIREALDEALTLCEAPLRKESVDLRINIAPDLPRVESRSHQIQQLFLNLLSNARHALAEKYPAAHPDKILAISAQVLEREGGPVVQIKLRDHGTGIPPALLEKVMNPFVTTKPSGVGTGLGLSICFEIVKKHGGTLSVASQHGEWTEVTATLPACKRTVV